MNFTEYMNKQIFSRYSAIGRIVAIGEQISSAYFADTYVDLANADIICDLESEFPDIYAHHVRLGEVLEHLTRDADLLRHLRDRTESLLVTVPFNGVAPYHVRLHNRWSITQLLHATGWRIVEYTPRKAPRLDRFIAYVRGVVKLITRTDGEIVNRLFLALNNILPIKPNGGYFFCVPGSVRSISEVNQQHFNSESGME